MRTKLTTSVMIWAAAVLLCGGSCGCGTGEATEQPSRPDLVTLAPSAPGGERPPVQFPHDLHAQALSEHDEDCTRCHPLDDDQHLSLLFMRLPDDPAPDLERHYHDACIGCHKETAAEGRKSGPDACGDCHRKIPVYTSSLVPFGFDKSLHYRHIKAFEDKCDACHHDYDQTARKLVYVEGKEKPCRDCHRERTEDNRVDFKTAAHGSCVECHRERALAKPEAPVGPQSCAGCHDPQKQAAIEVVENPPRLKRGQPDFVLIAAPEAEIEASKLRTVPFPHAIHEQATETCRSCHHETLSRCVECHTLAGDDKGDGVTLQQAMHTMTSTHSCVGCHQLHKTDTACSGCHDLMEAGRLTKHSCVTCHTGPPPEEFEASKSKYASLDDFPVEAREVLLTMGADEVPDTVVIASASGDSAGVGMPHRKIVAALQERISKSRLATRFHGRESVACQGCHHHGAVGTKPALCENCHNEPFRESELFVPGLKGAYHRQCVGCHLSMGLQGKSNCDVCHAPEQPETSRAKAPRGPEERGQGVSDG